MRSSYCMVAMPASDSRDMFLSSRMTKVSASAPAAIGAVSEDPKAFGKAIIFVALGEAVAIYGFVISILIWIKLPSFA